MIYSPAPTHNTNTNNYTNTNSSSADIYANQRLFQLMLTQQMNNIFSFDSDGSSSNVNYGSSDNSSLAGLSDFINNSANQIKPVATQPQNQVINYAHMIGKKVEGIVPTTGEQFSGTVKSVINENNIILLDLGEALVSPEYITVIKGD